MTTFDFQIGQDELTRLLSRYPNIGKNSDVGKFAVEVVKLYFLSKDKNASFKICKGGADLEVITSGASEEYEVKGTIDKNICFQKLKVSSHACYNALINGMVLIRVTGIGSLTMRLHFMKFKEDFLLVPELRWAVVRPKFDN